VTATLQVEDPGLFSTVQDLGRPGTRHTGVPLGGAMDRFALAAANLLVGNPEAVGALECALSGPTLVALRPCLVAITGADFDPAVNGRPAPNWTSLFLAEGDRLAFGGRRRGARCYVAIAGGLAADRWLGSVGTDLAAARGGLRGRPLRAGDELRTTEPPPRGPRVAGRHLMAALRPAYSDRPRLATVAGPHVSCLSLDARRLFFEETFVVSDAIDRGSYRLTGPQLATNGDAPAGPFALCNGCVQVLRSSGQAVIQMADHEPAGSDPAVAGVARADQPLVAQLMPGDRLMFEEVAPEEASARWRRLRSGLEALRGAARGAAARRAAAPA
jgi:biotin-dependent carboxylase-like uncharacterized protein